MNQRAILAAVLLFFLIIVGMFVFAYLKRSELTQVIPGPVSQRQTEVKEPETAKRIDVKHFFVDGVHTIAGEIAMPTPCDLLETNAVIFGSEPQRAILSFGVINESGGQCAQVVTRQRFKISFNAGEDVAIEALYEGQVAILNFIEAGKDESPDDFELFIKG